jgi:glycosyltransferase involved in cell wall biosynthesis
VSTPEATDSISVSYLVPAHNSAASIESTLKEIGAHLAGRCAEIIVVENGSADRTPELLAQIERDWSFDDVDLRVLTSAKGLGNALRAGIAASRGDRVVFGADDLPFGFDDLDAADKLDSAKHPVVIGSKAHPASKVERGLVRDIATFGFLSLRWVVLGMRTRDPQGTFILRGDWIRGIAGKLTEPGFLLTTEVVYLAERSGIRTVEVPVRLRESHEANGTRIKLDDVYKMGKGLFTIRLRNRR